MSIQDVTIAAVAPKIATASNILIKDEEQYCELSHNEASLRDNSYSSRVSGQYLAGSGALVFEGELLEMPIWG